MPEANKIAEKPAEKPASPAPVAEKPAPIVQTDDDTETLTDAELDAIEKNASRDATANSEAARDKLRNIAASYPVTTPNEHVIFGAAGIRFTLGELRALFGIKR